MYIEGINPTDLQTAAEITSGVENGRFAGVGDIGLDADGRQYVWSQASAAINAFDAVTLTSASIATQLVAAGPGKFAVCPVTVATGDRFWAQCRGVATANVVGAAASNTNMSWTTTAGRLTTSTTNQRLYGITTLTSTTLTTTGTVSVFMHVEPFIVLPV